VSVVVEALGTPTHATNYVVAARRRHLVKLHAIRRGNAATVSRQLLGHLFRLHRALVSDIPVVKGEEFEDIVAFDG